MREKNEEKWQKDNLDNIQFLSGRFHHCWGDDIISPIGSRCWVTKGWVAWYVILKEEITLKNSYSLYNIILGQKEKLGTIETKQYVSSW